MRMMLFVVVRRKPGEQLGTINRNGGVNDEWMN
jgi:hypothetical protein